jgi:hypothetical protein
MSPPSRHSATASAAALVSVRSEPGHVPPVDQPHDTSLAAHAAAEYQNDWISAMQARDLAFREYAEDLQTPVGHPAKMQERQEWEWSGEEAERLGRVAFDTRARVVAAARLASVYTTGGTSRPVLSSPSLPPVPSLGLAM